ncbi:hypothetical protein Achl_3126 [Pseudarthrobacter chlorophenolicus A6]|uniref:Uncharacterized protein n=1 Tax=Pseudarthrobacter chlorophenolicus (strain ATCC 700700 / DSM 12829 / CIP 107037 / JCM 12360 / KCTC 9906 / NCIMB 13794 / A6) TaxID=452863 RepID=B8HFB9_PSECP|nr:hypothetical protein Achl_3126 [Pseudarthrobacter chlorophenolicus A6]SDQ70138.1 hypothetical protein SAMN04489738_2355 [Pseudarthrobacter chlorophenolicus]
MFLDAVGAVIQALAEAVAELLWPGGEERPQDDDAPDT